jgi:hypothetical protein
MANLLSRIPVVRDIIQKMSEGDAAKRALEQLYSRHNIGQGFTPGRWYQRVDPGSGNLKGVAYACTCGGEHRLLSFAEIFAGDMLCKASGTEINFLKAIKATDASGKFIMTASQVRGTILSLPVRPVGIAESRTRYLDTASVDDSPVSSEKEENRRMQWV